jgi:hypothetical protein
MGIGTSGGSSDTAILWRQKPAEWLIGCIVN